MTNSYKSTQDRILEIVQELRQKNNGTLTEQQLFRGYGGMTNNKHITVNYTGNTPQQATTGSAGADLVCADGYYRFEPGETGNINTGTSVAIPEGHVGLLTLRSSLGKRGFTMPHGVGIIDSDYRGELMFRVTYMAENNEDAWINKGERIGQLIILPLPAVTYTHVNQLDPTERGTGGFGSTGN